MTETGIKKGVKYYIFIQILNIIFSMSSVLTKMASLSWDKKGFFHFDTIAYVIMYVGLLAIYAFFWQKVIKRISLSSAYLNKGLLLFWNLLWAVIIFSEKITAFNIIGAIIIFVGTMLVNYDE
jgi:drug/metabolite transporter (DMT)-like permease